MSPGGIRVEVVHEHGSRWYWRLVSCDNGKVLATSIRYDRKDRCMATAEGLFLHGFFYKMMEVKFDKDGVKSEEQLYGIEDRYKDDRPRRHSTRRKIDFAKFLNGCFDFIVD